LLPGSKRWLRRAGFCLSVAAHEQVRDRLDIVFDDLGEQQVPERP